MATDLILENRPLVTRDEAISSGSKRYFTGQPCSRGHVAERNVSSKGCLECAKENAAKWRDADPERAKAVWTKNNHTTRDQRVEKKRQGRVVLCPHCQTPIPAPTLKPGAVRASRPRYCSNHCKLYSKVDKTPGHGPKGDCWVFTGAKHKFGYGMINKFDNKESEVVTSHVFAWEVENGPIPDGQFVLHKCDYPPCCRESHLFLGSHQDNVDDMISKERNCRGVDHASAKLTEDDVRAIRRDAGRYSDRELAERYGVSHGLIQGIRKYRRWKHVT